MADVSAVAAIFSEVIVAGERRRMAEEAGSREQGAGRREEKEKEKE